MLCHYCPLFFAADLTIRVSTEIGISVICEWRITIVMITAQPKICKEAPFEMGGRPPPCRKIGHATSTTSGTIKGGGAPYITYYSNIPSVCVPPMNTSGRADPMHSYNHYSEYFGASPPSLLLLAPPLNM